MAAYKFPEVYPTIRDNTGVVVDNAVTSVGYVGESEFGPVFKPTLCTGLQNFVDQFGK